MGVLFASPQQEFEIIREEWLHSVQELAKRGVFVGGPSVTKFEDEFAQYLGAQAVVGVGNGTDALFLALKALGVGPGDEVITAANTFIATVEAIHHTGARPVLVDCDPHHYLINLEQVKQSVTERTKAIIPVHLYGQMVDLSELSQWAKERNIYVIEDSAQAAGATLHGKRAGSIGDMGCFSFYPDKNLGALGDGGAITVSSETHASIVRKLRNHGGETKYTHEIPGFNSRLDPIQAIALELKLRHLEEWSKHRRETAALYTARLQEIEGVVVPRYEDDGSHVFHLYVIRVNSGIREDLRKHLQKKGILTAVHYPAPVHLTPAFSYLGYAEGSFPYAEQYAEEIISLPIHISMSAEKVEFVVKQIKEFFNLLKLKEMDKNVSVPQGGSN